MRHVKQEPLAHPTPCQHIRCCAKLVQGKVTSTVAVGGVSITVCRESPSSKSPSSRCNAKVHRYYALYAHTHRKRGLGEAGGQSGVLHRGVSLGLAAAGCAAYSAR